MNVRKRHLKAVQLFSVLIVVLFNFSCASPKEENQIEQKRLDFAKDVDSRERQLELVPVGALPSNATYNVFTLLSHINKQIDKYGVRSCRLIFQCDPEHLLGKTLTTDIREISDSDGIGTEELLGLIGIKSTKLERAHLESMNLRQLLWFMCRRYGMSVHFYRDLIVVGTGFASEYTISPGKSSDKHVPSNLINEPDPFK